VSRSLWYFAANLTFAMLVAIGTTSDVVSGVHPLYLLALFLLCSTPILHLRGLNDRHALPGLFFGVYFISYGLVDLEHLLGAVPGLPDGTWLSDTEQVILAGGACAYAAYLLAGRIWRSGAPLPQQDWPESTVIGFGGLIWLVGTFLSWRFKLYVVSDTVIQHQQANLAQAGMLLATIYVLATYLQPLGMLILAYGETRYRRGWMLPVVIGVVLVQVLMGFIEDSKGDTVLGLIIVLLTKTLVTGKVPRRWVLASVMSVGLAWPVMQANRYVREHYSLDRTQVASHILQTLERAVEAKTTVNTGVERANTFFERASFKGSVEMIVRGTEHGTPFQHGYTLTPIVLTFIPRLLWPGKPDVQPGLLMNKVFQVAPDEPDTYISPSHLGELYWNFGWSGALVGMFLLGLLLGYMGIRFELAGAVTLTRVMVVVLTARQLVLGFESAIAGEYVVWLRSLAAVWLLDLALSRRSAVASEQEPEQAGTQAAGIGPAQPYFPNLMR
jgi:hypothetical protein